MASALSFCLLTQINFDNRPWCTHNLVANKSDVEFAAGSMYRGAFGNIDSDLGPKASTTHALSFNYFHTSLHPMIEESIRLQVNVTTHREGFTLPSRITLEAMMH